MMMCLSNSQDYPSQTKIFEGGTNEETRIFNALFKGVSTQFGPCSIEKSVENPDIIFCSSFQNLRLGSINFVKMFEMEIVEKKGLVADG
jgi:hypothetical protein